MSKKFTARLLEPQLALLKIDAAHSRKRSDLDKVYYTWPKPLDKRTPGTPNYYVSEKRPDWW